ncbi:calcitonin gene-related peptide type 1 receptor-like [Elysia marginata]|uniref:Calcitonin gene-related peptide type 1 receptor-like n=1 Tax=Elysia marginata TaxID=1093978 RepID=A0AAV4FEF2_9GAST|nr:calcitonin gene-related peptide type 1 receptor-like [Elysia marginata]
MNGTWRVNDRGEAWTDRINCLKDRAPPSTSGVDGAFSYVYLFIAGACLSLVLLIIALSIFYGFRQLRCDRVTVHKNLFISFACTALAWILYYSLVVLRGEVILDNQVPGFGNSYDAEEYRDTGEIILISRRPVAGS